MNILVAHLFAVPCNTSLPFPLKDSEFNMPPKRPKTNAGRAAARPASPGKGARNGSHPVASESGTSQPASSAGSCSLSATVSTTYQGSPEDLAQARARVIKLGRFPNRIMAPKTEAEREEQDLWMYLWTQKRKGIPDEVWNELRRYGAPQPVDFRQVLLDDVEAFVKKFRRFPKRSSRKCACSEMDKLAKRLQHAKDRFDDEQQARFIALQEQCDAAIQDGKRVAWRMLLDDVSQFVRDSRRWPCRQKCERERFRNLDNPNRSYLKEELLCERLAKTTKEFDEAHLTELRNLQKDAEQKAVEDLVQEVTELGYWLHSQLNKVSIVDLYYRPSNRVCRA